MATGQPTIEGYWRSAEPGTFAITPGREFERPAAAETPEHWLGEIDLTAQPQGLLRVAALLRNADARPLYRAEIPYALDLAPLRVFLSPVPSREQLFVDVDPVRHRKAWQQGWKLDLELFGDYFLYGMRELVRTAGWDGMYFDFCEGAKPDLNERHGSGYVDDQGKRRPTCDIRAQRDFPKRLWAMFQLEFGVDEPIIMVHLSANKLPPIHAFCSVYYDGEQHAYVLKVEDDYTKILSLDTYRAEFLGRQFGGVPVLLPELGQLETDYLAAKTPEAKETARARRRAAMDTMLLYPLLHGTLFQPAWLDREYLSPLLQARHGFGLGNARFIGYWENHSGIQLAPATDTLKASVYATPDKLWLVVGNLGETTVEARVVLDLPTLCPKHTLANGRPRNIFGVGTLEWFDKTLRLDVPRKSLRVMEWASAE